MQVSIVKLSSAIYAKAFDEAGDLSSSSEDDLLEAMKHLNVLREKLDTDDLHTDDKKYRDAADDIWWKLIVGAQNISPKFLSGVSHSYTKSSHYRFQLHFHM